MKLILHIVKKDMLRLRLPLFLWLALVVSQVVVEHLLLAGFRIGQWDNNTMQSVKLWLSVMVILVGFLIVAAAVLDDSTVETDAFWMTRPISSYRLFSAKLVFVALFFVLLPVLIWIPWWLHCGYGARAVLHEVASLAATNTIVWMESVVLAVLTGQSSRFLIAILTQFLSMWLVTLWFTWSRGAHHMSLMKVRAELVWLVMIATALAVVGLRLFSRRPLPSYFAALAGLLLVILIFA